MSYERAIQDGYIMIDGYKTYFLPNDKTDVFVCDKYENWDWKEGHWVPRFKYESKETWFPYSETDKPKTQIRYIYNKETNKKERVTCKVLHPPMYWDTNGNRLPGNNINNLSVDDIDINEFNYYSGGTFFTVALVMCILSILTTIFINGGWAAWIFFIPWFIRGYIKWNKYVNKYK